MDIRRNKSCLNDWHQSSVKVLAVVRRGVTPVENTDVRVTVPNRNLRRAAACWPHEACVMCCAAVAAGKSILATG